MDKNEVNVGDSISIWKVSVDNDGYVNPESNSNIIIVRKLRGEKLKNELLSQDEINTQIIEVKQNKDIITITCRLTDYYYEYSSSEIETFEIDIKVNKETTIFGTTENQLENIQKIMKYNDNTYIRLNAEEKQKGNLVAENIEVMGC